MSAGYDIMRDNENGGKMTQIFLTILGGILIGGGIGFWIGRKLGRRATLLNQGKAILKSMPNICYLGYGIVIIYDKDNRIFRSIDYGVTWTDFGILPGKFE